MENKIEEAVEAFRKLLNEQLARTAAMENAPA